MVLIETKRKSRKKLGNSCILHQTAFDFAKKVISQKISKPKIKHMSFILMSLSMLVRFLTPPINCAKCNVKNLSILTVSKFQGCTRPVLCLPHFFARLCVLLLLHCVWIMYIAAFTAIFPSEHMLKSRREYYLVSFSKSIPQIWFGILEYCNNEL